MEVYDHVAMAHVADVDASVGFYAKLGFQCESRFSDQNGQTYYAAICADAAELMLVRANGPVLASQQAVLFYMYSPDVSGLRQHLLSNGLIDGGDFAAKMAAGQAEPVATNTAFSLTRPFYMPDGELRLHDLDGYVVLIGQLENRKPSKRNSPRRGLAQVAITVKDVEECVKFYRDVIGLKLLLQPNPNLAFLTDGSVRLMLSTPQGIGAVGANSILYFHAPDIAKRFDEMVELGARKEREPQLAARLNDHDVWIGFVRDFDGNLIGIIEEKPTI
jgi:catechol 2,3-dioxygenase-like lactoylglutathione lyase family enzyme